MADAPRSPLAPIEQLSFQTCVMIGAALGLVLAGVAWGLGPVDVHDGAGLTASAGKVKPRRKVVRDAEDDGGHDRRLTRGGGVGGGDRDEDDERYRGEEREEGGADDGRAEGGRGEDERGAAAGSGDEGGRAGDEGGRAGDDAEDAEIEDDEIEDDEIDERSDGDPSGGHDELVVDDEPGDGGSRAGSKGPGPSVGTPASSGSSSAEAQMTAAEMREEAKKALSEKRYRDAYRLATRSYYKEKSNETLEIKGKAACGMNDERAAKSAIKALPVGDDRRKEIRGYCRDRGLRLGI